MIIQLADKICQEVPDKFLIENMVDYMNESRIIEYLTEIISGPQQEKAEEEGTVEEEEL